MSTQTQRQKDAVKMAYFVLREAASVGTTPQRAEEALQMLEDGFGEATDEAAREYDGVTS